MILNTENDRYKYSVVTDILEFEIEDYIHSHDEDCIVKPEMFIKYECLTWQMKNSDKILVKHMTDNHIQNCINLIIKYNWRKEWLKYFEKVIDNRRVKSRKRKLKKVCCC
jgi:hypothetical protein